MALATLFLVACTGGPELPLVLDARTGGVDFMEMADHTLLVLHADGSTTRIQADGTTVEGPALGPARRLSFDGSGGIATAADGLTDVAPGCEGETFGLTDRGLVRGADRQRFGPVIDGLTGIAFAECDRMLAWGGDAVLWVDASDAEVATGVPRVVAAAVWEGEVWAASADGWLYRQGEPYGHSGGPVRAMLFGHGAPLHAGALYLLRDAGVDYLAIRYQGAEIPGLPGISVR